MHQNRVAWPQKREPLGSTGHCYYDTCGSACHCRFCHVNGPSMWTAAATAADRFRAFDLRPSNVQAAVTCSSAAGCHPSTDHARQIAGNSNNAHINRVYANDYGTHQACAGAIQGIQLACDGSRYARALETAARSPAQRQRQRQQQRTALLTTSRAARACTLRAAAARAAPTRVRAGRVCHPAWKV